MLMLKKCFKVQPGLDINSPDNSDLVGGTPLHWACYGNNQVALTRFLMTIRMVQSVEIRRSGDRIARKWGENEEMGRE